MALDHSAVGVPSAPYERSWTSTDALLYAVGVGAGSAAGGVTKDDGTVVIDRGRATFR